jgi:hypothetical protein
MESHEQEYGYGGSPDKNGFGLNCARLIFYGSDIGTGRDHLGDFRRHLLIDQPYLILPALCAFKVIDPQEIAVVIRPDGRVVV